MWLWVTSMSRPGRVSVGALVCVCVCACVCARAFAWVWVSVLQLPSRQYHTHAQLCIHIYFCARSYTHTLTHTVASAVLNIALGLPLHDDSRVHRPPKCLQAEVFQGYALPGSDFNMCLHTCLCAVYVCMCVYIYIYIYIHIICLLMRTYIIRYPFQIRRIFVCVFSDLMHTCV
jgi:hypothetical protein